MNDTGGSVTRLRFRIVDLDTFPAASGFADLRARTSDAVVVAGITDAATCAATGAPATPPCTATVQGTTLEQPPDSQPNGSGFNSSMRDGTITLGTPLANGASPTSSSSSGCSRRATTRSPSCSRASPQGGGDVFYRVCTQTAVRTADGIVHREGEREPDRGPRPWTTPSRSARASRA